MSVNHTAKRFSIIHSLHPVGTDECRYPHFQNKQEFVLGGGVSFNIVTQNDHCHAGRVFFSALICFCSHMV